MSSSTAAKRRQAKKKHAIAAATAANMEDEPTTTPNIKPPSTSSKSTSSSHHRKTPVTESTFDHESESESESESEPTSTSTSTPSSTITSTPSATLTTSTSTSTSTPIPGVIGARGTGLSIKVISRDEQAYTRQRKTDIHKVFHNVDPKLHPFERAREYTRALQATKLSKIFAKPFLGALDGHADAVHSMTTSPVALSTFYSGAADGEIRSWNLTTRECQWSVRGHTGFVRGLCMDAYGQHVYSCSTDQTIKVWSARQDDVRHGDIVRPIHTILGKTSFSGIDHHRRDDIFATASTQVDIWDETRTEPIHSFTWGCDSVLHVKLNPVEVNVLVSTASDRNIVLYDIRTKTPIRKMIMKMMTNAVTWNPMEAFNFTTANEDHNAYTFDMRHLDHALNIHQDHVSAVMSVDYAPTGRVIVTGSYDRTIRIFGVDEGHSREVYHTKRMQRLFCVKYSADNKYILSGSDDTNIRLWKAQASEKLATVSAREQNKKNYLGKLQDRYQYAPEIRRIYKHRHVPRAISVAQRRKHEAKGFAAAKAQRVRAHSKPGAVPYQDAKKASIVTHVK